jgi:hypothetical protein
VAADIRVSDAARRGELTISTPMRRRANGWKTVFHFERNHFDRVVHFLFGLFLAYSQREVLLHKAGLRGAWSIDCREYSAPAPDYEPDRDGGWPCSVGSGAVTEGQGIPLIEFP